MNWDQSGKEGSIITCIIGTKMVANSASLPQTAIFRCRQESHTSLTWEGIATSYIDQIRDWFFLFLLSIVFPFFFLGF